MKNNSKTTLVTRLSLVVWFASMGLAAWASRAKGDWHVFTQPDGTTVTASLRGNAAYHYYVTPSGAFLELDAEGFMRPVARDVVARARARSMARHDLPAANTSWNPERIYRQAVVLVAFADRDFTSDDAQARYDDIFNRPGYNEGKGPGCVADYFRQQSGGLFNLQFDVYGPVKVSMNASDNDNKTQKHGSFGSAAFRMALKQLADTADIDFSVYDWDGNGSVEQVIFIYAGYGGNENATAGKGYIWPNTSTMSSVSASGKTMSNYTASAELWSSNKSCGIGTICHEFSHSLGLPDIYPVKGNDEYSIVDEWDLMDGGNFTNNGWCPCNYSALEKMLMGWLTPSELAEGQHVEVMKPVTEDGEVFIVRNTDDEFYLLENRQWQGFDSFLPGRGLLVSHVDYDKDIWATNSVNNSATHHRYDIMHADNLDYYQWLAIVPGNPYVDNRSRLLSGSAYPYVDDTSENRSLTDESVPAAVVFNANAHGSKFMSKPITNIYMADDGTVSFDFMKAETPVEVAIVEKTGTPVTAVFTLGGQQRPVVARRGMAIERRADGTVRKIVR